MTWVESTLGEVAQWSSGGTPQARNPAYYNGPIPWAVIGDLNDGTVSGTKSSITEAGLSNSSAKVVPPGTILLAMYGSIGKLGVAGVPMATNQAIATAQVHDCLESRYLFYYLLSQRRALDAAGKGATQRNISQSIVKPWPIRYPRSRDEQSRIVAILEDHLSRLDAATSYLRASESRQVTLSYQFLTAALSDIECRETKFTEVLRGGLSNGRSVPTQEDGFPVLRLTALGDGRVDLSERKSGAWTARDAERFLVARGDFLISRGNGSLRLVGLGGLVANEPDPVAYPDTLIRARPDTTRLVPEYLALVWNSPIVRRQIERLAKTTAGIYKVNQKDLGSITLPVPSPDDQTRIVSTVGASRDALTSVGRGRELALSRAHVLRQLLLAAAFAGRLTGQADDFAGVGEMVGV